MNLLQRNPAARWAAVALIGIVLVALPFALSQVGTAWVRITNLAILFTLLALGLNIVVGFAGLLDLGYVAFYAVGAYAYALLASPHFGLHLPFWVILPIGAATAAQLVDRTVERFGADTRLGQRLARNRGGGEGQREQHPLDRHIAVARLLGDLLGLIEDAGQIIVDGKAVKAPQTDVGIMFQDNTLVPWRTVRGNVDLQLEMRGLDPRRYKDRVLGLLGQVKLLDFADRFPHELSGGMQQRAAFCQAMVHDPHIMLLDEPLGKLDAMTRESIRTDLQSLWMTRRPTVIFVTHSIEEAVQLSSQVAVITPRPGRIDRLIDINLPFPRDLGVKNSPEFISHVREIQEIFRGYGVI